MENLNPKQTDNLNAKDKRNLNPKIKEETLNWLLDFVQKDLLRSSEEEKAILNIRFTFLVRDYFLTPDQLPDEDLRRALNKLKEYRFDERQVEQIQAILKGFFSTLLESRSNPKIFVELPAVKRTLGIGDEYTISLYTDKSLWLDRKTIQKLAKQKIARELIQKANYIIDWTAALLEDIPRDAIKECPNCGKLFAHLSAKEKIYCSPQCAYRFLSRKRREDIKEDPERYEAFLQKQRAAMQKIYEKRRQAKSVEEGQTQDRVPDEELFS